MVDNYRNIAGTIGGQFEIGPDGPAFSDESNGVASLKQGGSLIRLQVGEGIELDDATNLRGIVKKYQDVLVHEYDEFGKPILGGPEVLVGNDGDVILAGDE